MRNRQGKVSELPRPAGSPVKFRRFTLRADQRPAPVDQLPTVLTIIILVAERISQRGRRLMGERDGQACTLAEVHHGTKGRLGTFYNSGT